MAVLKNKKIMITLLSPIFVIILGVIGYTLRYKFLPINYLIEKAEDECIIRSNNNLYQSKECICFLKSVLVVIPENEIRSFIIKTLNKDEIGIKRLLSSNLNFMNTIMAAGQDKKCNDAKMRFHNGLLKIYDEQNNKLKEEQIWRDDKLVHFTSYYNNGNVSMDIDTADIDLNTNNVVSHGNAIFYYENGQLKEKAYYKNGKKEGKQVEYYESGAIKSISTYKNNIFNGQSKIYYENGNIQDEINYKNGKPNSMKTYRDNGSLLADVNFYNDDKMNVVKYYENGNIMLKRDLQNDKIIGIEEWYRDDGTLLSKVSFKDGKQDGLSKTFYGDGSICERMWNNDKPQQKKCFNKEGKNIVLNGLVKFYHKNGKLEAEDNYVNGNAEGISKIYYTNGNLKEEVYWKNDKLNGDAKIFNLNGELILIQKYKNGELLK